MKKIFIMSIITMLSSLYSCQAQNKGYKSLSADDYEKAIADTAVIRLDVPNRRGVCQWAYSWRNQH